MSHLYAGLAGAAVAFAACATWRGWYDVAVILATGAVLLGLVARKMSVGGGSVQGTKGKTNGN